MKNIVDQFRDVLKNECLNPTEKMYLKNFFRKFIEKREIISRHSIDLQEEKEEDSSREWIQNNIG